MKGQSGDENTTGNSLLMNAIEYQGMHLPLAGSRKRRVREKKEKREKEKEVREEIIIRAPELRKALASTCRSAVFRNVLRERGGAKSCWC